MLRVEGHSDLIRDPKSNAILNTNHDDYERYVRQKRISEERKLRQEETDRKIEELNQSILEMKSLIEKVLER